MGPRGRRSGGGTRFPWDRGCRWTRPAPAPLSPQVGPCPPTHRTAWPAQGGMQPRPLARDRVTCFSGKVLNTLQFPPPPAQPPPAPPPLVLNRFDGQDRPGPRQSVGFTEGAFVSARGAPGPLRPQGPAPHRRLRLQLRVPVFTAPGRGQTPQEGMSAVPSGAAASRPGTQPGAPGTGTPAGVRDGPGAGRRASTPGLTGAPRPRALGLLLRGWTVPLTGRGWWHWPLRAQEGAPAGRAGTPSGQRGHKPMTRTHSEGETP